VGPIDRRRFLTLMGAAGLTAVTQAPLARAARDLSPIAGYPFTLGVASGDPTPDGAVLWTRLAPAPLSGGGMPQRNVPVDWEVARDEGFRRTVRSGTATAAPRLGHSVHVELEGLGAGREYFYRFRADGEVSRVGRLRTAPAPGRPVDRLRFAFASCSQYEHGFFTAYGRMAEEDLDVVLHLGDYIYEYGPNVYRAPGGNVRIHSGPEIVSLTDYRNRHAQYKTDPDLQLAHARHPWVVTWDDHELDNNWADEVPEDAQPIEAYLRRRAAALQAYYEHMPLRRRQRPRGIDLRLYRRLTYGDLVSFNVLDTRQYRSDQPCGDRFRSDCPERFAPTQTITGPEQERWLLAGLEDSRTRWNVLAQQVFFANVDYQAGPEIGINPDAWDGYVASRDRILGAIAERNVDNPIVLTGDVHRNFAADLKANFADPASETLGSEFVATSITSGGDGADTSPTDPALLAENPHVKFTNNQRGYVRCTVDRSQWRSDFRVVPYVKRPGAPVTTRQSFVVEAGRPGLQPV